MERRSRDDGVLAPFVDMCTSLDLILEPCFAEIKEILTGIEHLIMKRKPLWLIRAQILDEGTSDPMVTEGEDQDDGKTLKEAFIWLENNKRRKFQSTQSRAVEVLDDSLCRMALGRLETLLFVDSNDPPPIFLWLNSSKQPPESCYLILRTQILRHCA